MKTLIKIIALLTPVERRKALWVLFLLVGMALFEALSVISLTPFLAVLGNPDLVETNSTLAWLFKYAQSFGGLTRDMFLFWLGVGSFVIITVSAAYRTLTHYIVNLFIEMRRESIASRVLEIYFAQPYSFFLGRHSAELSKTLLTDTDRLISEVIYPSFYMIAYSFVVIAITATLISVDPLLGLLGLGVIAGLYLLAYRYLRKKLAEIGVRLLSTTSVRFMEASEAFGGIKTIKLLGYEASYLNRFQMASKQLSIASARQRTLSQVPKFIIEAFAFGGIMLVVLFMLHNAGGMNDTFLGQTLPIVGLYTFSAYRLQPAVQNVFQGAASLRIGKALVENFHQINQMKIGLENLFVGGTLTPLQARNKITLENLSYSYPDTSAPVLRDINFEIAVGSTVGIVGSTGAGKSTLVEVLLGLLSPTHGALLVDGVAVVGPRILQWQKSLGYVPQEIYLSHTSIYQNIAFGVPEEQIDKDHVHRCATLAQVHEFIEQDLPFRYDTEVGERGVRLSGGQRQRIGIARALYHNPEVLLLDEATSALDTDTENDVMNAIEKLAKQKTLIIIAHRLSTLKKCDQIMVLEEGKIHSVATYDEIIEGNRVFRTSTDSGHQFR